MKNERLLIIDDELSIRELLEILFEQDGYHVQTVGSAEEGFDILRSQKIDLVLSDLNLPKMSGLELLQKLKRENIETDFICQGKYCGLLPFKSSVSPTLTNWLPCISMLAFKSAPFRRSTLFLSEGSGRKCLSKESR